MTRHYYPLSNTFMVVSILGTAIFGWLTIFERISIEWGFTITFMFIIFIIAAVISSTPDDILMSPFHRK